MSFLFKLKKCQFIFPSIIILLLFVTPFITSVELYSGTIIAKEIWFFGVIAIIFFYFAIKLMFTGGKLLIQLNFPDILLLAFYIWCFIRACFTPYTPFYYNHKLQLLTGCILVYFFIKSVITNERNKKTEDNTIQKRSVISGFFNSVFFNNSFIYSLLIFSFIVSGLLQAVYGLLQLYGFYSSNHGMFRITGSFFNPAPYALYLAAVFPIALGQYLFSKNEKVERIELNRNNKFFAMFSSVLDFFTQSFLKYISILTLTAIILVLPATMIRAAWLGALAGSLVVLQVKYDYIGIIRRWLNSTTKVALVCLATFIILTIVCIGLYKLKEGSSVGKSFIWEVTIGEIIEKPLFGHGLSRFEAEYNNWQADYFIKHPAEMDGSKGSAAGNTKYCFNEYLEFASETGIVGLGLFLGAIITLLLGLNKKVKNEELETNGIISKRNVIFISSVISFVVIFLVSFPLYSVPTLLLFYTIMGIGSASIAPVTLSIKLNIPGLLKYPLAALSMICIYLLILNANKQYNTFYYWDEAQKLYSSGSYNEANNSFGEACKQNQFNGLLIQSYGKSLVMDSNYVKGITMLMLAQQYTSDEVLYTTMGDCHKALKEYRQAEKAYQYASYMVPHKLYPHYLLAKLYIQNGDTAKAYLKAKQLLSKKAKVESMAEEEIKQEMLEITKKYLSGQKKEQNAK